MCKYSCRPDCWVKGNALLACLFLHNKFLTILLVNKEKTFSFKYARNVLLYIAHSVDQGLVNFRTDRISWPARLESAVIPCRPLVFIIFKISSKMKIKTKEKIQLNHLVQCA